MAVRKIITAGDPILRRRAPELDPNELGSEKLDRLIRDMAETMVAAKGVGIAAPQVGESVRVFLADSADGPVALINPRIVKRSKKMLKDEEGCLSVPGRWGTVERHKSVEVEALAADGKPVRFTAENFFARVIQHELDHLDGILFIDRMKAPEVL